MYPLIKQTAEKQFGQRKFLDIGFVNRANGCATPTNRKIKKAND